MLKVGNTHLATENGVLGMVGELDRVDKVHFEAWRTKREEAKSKNSGKGGYLDIISLNVHMERVQTKNLEWENGCFVSHMPVNHVRLDAKHLSMS